MVGKDKGVSRPAVSILLVFVFFLTFFEPLSNGYPTGRYLFSHGYRKVHFSGVSIASRCAGKGSSGLFHNSRVNSLICCF